MPTGSAGHVSSCSADSTDDGVSLVREKPLSRPFDCSVINDVLGVVIDVSRVKFVVADRDELVLVDVVEAVRPVEARAAGLADNSGCA